jgi:hypothetical protein
MLVGTLPICTKPADVADRVIHRRLALPDNGLANGGEDIGALV